MTPFKERQLMSEEEYLNAQDEYGEEASGPASAPKR